MMRSIVPPGSVSLSFPGADVQPHFIPSEHRPEPILSTTPLTSAVHLLIWSLKMVQRELHQGGGAGLGVALGWVARPRRGGYGQCQTLTQEGGFSTSSSLP